MSWFSKRIWWTVYPSPYAGSKLHKSDSSPFTNPTLYRYSTITQQNISFTFNRLSLFLQVPSEIQWKACKQLLHYLKGSSSLSLIFKQTAYLHLKALHMLWGLAPLMFTSLKRVLCVSWDNLLYGTSKKKKIVSRSSNESAYQALAHENLPVFPWSRTSSSVSGWDFTKQEVA